MRKLVKFLSPAGFLHERRQMEQLLLRILQHFLTKFTQNQKNKHKLTTQNQKNKHKLTTSFFIFKFL